MRSKSRKQQAIDTELIGSRSPTVKQIKQRTHSTKRVPLTNVAEEVQGDVNRRTKLAKKYNQMGDCR